jgi:hypothetical protein
MFLLARGSSPLPPQEKNYRRKRACFFVLLQLVVDISRDWVYSIDAC